MNFFEKKIIKSEKNEKSSQAKITNVQPISFSSGSARDGIRPTWPLFFFFFFPSLFLSLLFFFWPSHSLQPMCQGSLLGRPTGPKGRATRGAPKTGALGLASRRPIRRAPPARLPEHTGTGAPGLRSRNRGRRRKEETEENPPCVSRQVEVSRGGSAMGSHCYHLRAPWGSSV